MGSTFTLPKAIGTAATLDILLTNRVVSAQEALTLGLVQTCVHDPVQMHERVMSMASTICGWEPAAVENTLKLMRTSADTKYLRREAFFQAHSASFGGIKAHRANGM